MKNYISLPEGSEVLSYHDTRKYPKKIQSYVMSHELGAAIRPLKATTMTLQGKNNGKCHDKLSLSDGLEKFGVQSYIDYFGHFSNCNRL